MPSLFFICVLSVDSVAQCVFSVAMGGLTYGSRWPDLINRRCEPQPFCLR